MVSSNHLEDGIDIGKKVAVKSLAVVKHWVHFSVVIEAHISIQVDHRWQVLTHDHGLQVKVDYLGTPIVVHVVAGSWQRRQESDFCCRHDAVDLLKEKQRQLRERVGANAIFHVSQASAVHRVRAEGVIESNHVNPVRSEAG